MVKTIGNVDRRDKIKADVQVNVLLEKRMLTLNLVSGVRFDCAKIRVVDRYDRFALVKRLKRLSFREEIPMINRQDPHITFHRSVLDRICSGPRKRKKEPHNVIQRTGGCR